MTEPSPKRLKMATSSPQPVSEFFNPYSFDKANFVTIIVGPDKHEMLVHASILTKTSEFFQTALKKEGRKEQIRTITMPDEDSETIAAYLNVLYRGQLPDQAERLWTAYRSCSKVYVLCCRLVDATVQKAAITRLHGLSRGLYKEQIIWDNTSEDCAGHEFVNAIYDGTTDSDPARRFVVDMHLERPQDLTPQHHPAFLLALAQAFPKRASTHPLPGCIVLELRSYLPVPREVTIPSF
jgi:hypothetical protein